MDEIQIANLEWERRFTMVADHPNCPAPRVSPEEDSRRRAAAAGETMAAPPKPKPQVAILAEQLAAATDSYISAKQSTRWAEDREAEAKEKMENLALQFDEEVKKFRAEIATP